MKINSVFSVKFLTDSRMQTGKQFLYKYSANNLRSNSFGQQ